MSEASPSPPPDLISEKGWVRPQADSRFWIPCPEFLPPEHDAATWYTMLAEEWWDRSGLPYRPVSVEALAAMIERAHGGYARVPVHQIWLYLRDPAVPPLLVHVGIWKMHGERAARLRFLTAADKAGSTRPPEVTEFAVDHLGTGIRVLQYRTGKKGVVALVGYAFRVEELETEVQISSATPDLRQLANALDDIDEWVRGLVAFSPRTAE